MRFRLLTALVALGCAACSPGGDTIVGGNMTAQATMSKIAKAIRDVVMVFGFAKDLSGFIVDNLSEG